VSGRNSTSPHLHHRTRDETESAVTIRYESQQGVFHDFWVEYTVNRDGSYAWRHCGDSGMTDLTGPVKAEL